MIKGIRLATKTSPTIHILISIFFLIGIALYMLVLSWQKWPDVLVDFGRELYNPWQINCGSLLYKDIRHLYGPLSCYFNALLFKLFGTSLLTLAIFNIGLVVLLTYFIYYLFLKTTDALTATITSATFLSIFAFGQYMWTGNYNFVCPYSHEVMHGIFLSFLSLYIFLMYLKKQKLWLVGIIGFVMGLISLTKVEVFLAILLAICFGLTFILLINRVSIRGFLKIFGIFCLGLLFPFIVFLIYFSLRASLPEAMKYLLLQYTVLHTSSIPSTIFYLRISGLKAPLLNAKKLLVVTGWYVAITSVFLILGYIVHFFKGKNLRRGIIFIIAGALLYIAILINKKIPLSDIIRPLPLVLLVEAVYLFISLIRSRRNPQEINRLLSLLVFTLFGLFLLVKMILNVQILHYGFALTLPGSLILVMVFLEHIPRLWKRLNGEFHFVRALGLILVGMAIVACVKISKMAYNMKDYTVSSGKDSIITFNPSISDRGPVMNDVLSKIDETLEEDDTFVVLPEGVILNYLCRHKNPSCYFEFTPPIVEMVSEEKIIESFEQTLPDYIILAERDTSEHGWRYFGADYGRKIFSWIKDNYTPIYLSGNPPLVGRGFGALITKRKNID